MNKLIFFNHFHRGDLFTHKEFARYVKSNLPDVKFEYWHFNHPKVNLDIDIPPTNAPMNLDKTKRFYKSTEGALMVNTWIGVYDEIFTKHGGVNLLSLKDSWDIIVSTINDTFKTNLTLNVKPLEQYLPTIDYARFDLTSIESFLERTPGKKVLLCNGEPMSNQSFKGNLKDDLELFSESYPDVTFICTSKFETSKSNIVFTDDIIKDTQVYWLDTPWNDRKINNCDLNEISYLSTNCDLIIGKNSGPFVFCETYANLMDTKKHIISFSKGEHESMSHGIHKECDYNLIRDHTASSIRGAIERGLNKL
jgi:hypothetical protein